jgi:hypothetical protein|tara:strand:- start:727 stop:1062 length:336 start_codon:yes stop_codon:yes gene_type:complete
MAVKYEVIGKSLTSSSQTSLLTAPAKQQLIIKSIRVSTMGVFTPSITFEVTDTSASATYTIERLKVLVGNQTIELLTNPVVLEESDILKVTSTTTDQLDIVISYMAVAQNE